MASIGAIFTTDKFDTTEATLVSVFVFIGFAYVISQRFLRSPVSFIAHECDACGHTFELFQGINDSVKKKCPDCGRLKLREKDP